FGYGLTIFKCRHIAKPYRTSCYGKSVISFIKKMKKNPYEGIKELAKTAYENDKKSLELIFDYSDKFITWLFGFSVAGISLIIANYDKLTKFSSINWVVVLLTSTIIFGFFYRLAGYTYMVKNRNLENYFSGYFGDFDLWPVKVEEDISTFTTTQMVNLIKDDFNEEPKDYHKSEAELNPNDLREYYLALIEHSKKYFYIGANSLGETYEVAYNVKKEKTVELMEMAFGLRENNKNLIGYNALLWKRLIRFLFVFSILSFLICIIVIAVSFIQ
ncbi:MAG: hypothetical protein ABI405_13130, partial [Parafilimonas sp.]